MKFLGFRISFTRTEPPPEPRDQVTAGVVTSIAALRFGPSRPAKMDPKRLGFLKYLIEAGYVHD